MQVAGSAYATSQPLYPYPNHYHHHHHPVPVAHDHELKRQYLTLLPPQQIIEICLTFDVHVPPYVKASVWPIDISAAIAGLRKQTTASSSSQQPKDAENATNSPPLRTEESGGGAIMDSLRAESSEVAPVPEKEAKSKDNVEEPRPPDQENKMEEPSSAGTLFQPSTSTSSTVSNTEAPATTETQPSSTSATSVASATTPAPAAHVPPPAEPAAPSAPPPPVATPALPHAAPAMPVAYPHQPYGYPYAPYYPPPPPGYPYPHHQYPAYPHQPQHAYPPPPPTSMAPVPPPPAQQMTMLQDGQSPDDLPSYEEMIVEALIDSNDPEGCAPRDLFTWMAARYPVQSNFRPSASQALQKAFKRGRLEKSSNNKYRLNAAWEGGNTSRRTTRRPQTHGHTMAPNTATSSSPFTNAPLVHHHHQQQHQSHQQQGYPYASYPYPQSSYSGYSQQASAPAAAGATPAISQTQPQPPVTAASTSTSTAEQQKSTEAAPSQDNEVNDAYEAAQNILKAINFGSLLQLPAEETQEGIAARSVHNHAQNNAAGYQQPSAPPQTLLAALNGSQASASAAPASTSAGGAQPSNSRADLQAQLALLAAQLAELARVDDGSSASVPGALQPVHTAVQHQPAQTVQPVISPPAVQQPKQQQHQCFQASPAPVAAQQPVFNTSLYPYPHMQRSFQTQPQSQPSQPQPQTPAHPIVDNSAPMASLLPPPPPPPASAPETQIAQPQPQAAQQQMQWSQSFMNLPQTQSTPQQQLPQPPDALQQSKESAPVPSSDATPGPTTNNEHANTNGDALTNVSSHEQHATSDGLAPLESMDTGLDGEYESDDDDDDMEEVV